eukprot:CAMPEP_0196661734 /NCGR_PEP_ID=MMETSP1086-20130531/45671_1 /TAXON_ID=77921 /ORGANISM="Cyanoptyche  gloeocystis , Strain SAG4.97" /LENGTH=128 /DNA_ID=CAMNT_0041996767 /DNA_START=289 /DNA_END=675 /DNA_ORIENTATION=-
MAAGPAVIERPPTEIKDPGVKFGDNTGDYETESGEGGQQVDRQKRTQYPGKWRVMLHNDNVNTRDHVVEVLTRTVPALTVEQAVAIMMEAHTNGMAIVIVCEKEHAEFYCDVLKSYQLWSTIEPDAVK